MRAQLSFNRPVRGIRVSHPVVTEGGVVANPPVLGLRDQMRQEKDAREALHRVCTDIQAAVAQIIPMVDCNLQGVTEIATELGLAIAREVVGEAIEDGRFDPTPVVIQCLRDAVQLGGADEHTPVVRVELAPEDLNLVLSRMESDVEIKALVHKVEFAADPTLGRGCATVTSNGGQLIYDPTDVLDRVATEVRKSAAQASAGMLV